MQKSQSAEDAIRFDMSSLSHHSEGANLDRNFHARICFFCWRVAVCDGKSKEEKKQGTTELALHLNLTMSIFESAGREIY